MTLTLPRVNVAIFDQSSSSNPTYLSFYLFLRHLSCLILVIFFFYVSSSSSDFLILYDSVCSDIADFTEITSTDCSVQLTLKLNHHSHTTSVTRSLTNVVPENVMN